MHVGWDTLAVGDDVYFFYARGVRVELLPGPPICLQVVHGDSDFEGTIRFPVAPGAREAAAWVLEHFNAWRNRQPPPQGAHGAQD